MVGRAREVRASRTRSSYSLRVIRLACSVRECAGVLRFEGSRAVCERGHSFDRARSGYWNLLQPHDRRSLAAGDSRETALARRRLHARGLQEPLARALVERLKPHVGARATRALDLGCGEGSLCAQLARELELELVGLDLSAHAIELAARAAPQHTWIVANADRRLPIVDTELDLVLSITGRRPAAEIARVLAPRGWLAVVVPAPDDLAELREVLSGSAHELAPARSLGDEFPGFELRESLDVRSPLELDAAGIADVCAISYRGARERERERLAGLASLRVTASWRVHLLQRAPVARAS